MRGQFQRRKQRGKEEGLTVSLQVCESGLGEGLPERIDGGDAGGRRLMTTALGTMQGFSARSSQCR